MDRKGIGAVKWAILILIGLFLIIHYSSTKTIDDIEDQLNETVDVDKGDIAERIAKEFTSFFAGIITGILEAISEAIHENSPQAPDSKNNNTITPAYVVNNSNLTQ